uniref:Leucine rich repeat containing 70 n=1 Tax=Pelusios castaneus TaxID=367368 RepID=A0A8C8RY47_9SAUR
FLLWNQHHPLSSLVTSPQSHMRVHKLFMFFLVISVFTCAVRIGLGVNVSACPRVCKCSPEDIIHCNKAGLRTLPPEIAASAMSLSLSNNFLKILTANTFRNLTFLRSLWLDHNNLTFLYPGVFSALGHLRELNLSRNSRLTYLHANTFRGLFRLISLDLSSCNIFEIHPLNNAFTTLNRLGELNLGHNQIAGLSNQIFKGLIQLKTMHLEANRLTSINCSFNRLPNLRKLYLNNNRISYISDSAFSHLKKLHFLHLNKNNLSSLPKHLFADLPKLSSVFLSHNPWDCDCKMLWFPNWIATYEGKKALVCTRCCYMDSAFGMSLCKML